MHNIPDIAQAIGIVMTYSTNPKESNMVAIMLKLMKNQPHNSQESPTCKHLSQKERSKSYGVWNSQVHI